MTIRRFLCFVIFHKLRTVQEFGPSQRKVLCTRCGTYYAMHDGMRAFLPWDDDFEDLYANMWGYGRTLK